MDGGAEQAELNTPPRAATPMSVFGPRARFPFAEGRSYTPSDAPKEKLFALHELLGIERSSSCIPPHTELMSVTADAVAAKGGSYLGVGLVPVTIPDAELSGSMRKASAACAFITCRT